jgi:uncharacterized protein
MFGKNKAVPSDVAFTPSVKAIQSRLGSRTSYKRMEERGGWGTTVTPELARVIKNQRSFYMATVNADGQPYIQHRGGPKGFLKVLSPTTLGFADYRGNRQYISMGNLVDNPKVHLFLMDYALQQRIKIWGEAHVIENDPTMVEELFDSNYQARPERVFLINIKAWDANCPQHIPHRVDLDDIRGTLAHRDQRIAELEAQVKELTASLHSVPLNR